MSDRLKDLYEQQGQSPWLDNLRRGYLTSGELAALRDRGVRGLTSNPSIFQKAIQGSSDYDDQFGELVRSGASISDDYWSLVRSVGSAGTALRKGPASICAKRAAVLATSPTS